MPSPLTRAEATDHQETSLHADVMAFLTELDGRGDPRFHLSSFGRSGQGRDLPLVVVARPGITTPEASRAAGLPVVLVQGGIHPGEVEGKESLLVLLRDLLDGTHADLVDQLTLVVAPLFNPDGNDALDPANRTLDLAHLTGQDGPRLVGTRATAAGINLNRDHLRLAAVEMRQLQTGVVQVWEPDLTIDTHATNGSVHRMAMTYDIPHTVASGRREPIEFMRSRLVPAMTAAVARDHDVLAGWYGNFVEDERALDQRGEADPTGSVGEGWMTYPHHPRFGSNYRGLTGRLDLLFECYSYLSFPDRVRTTHACLLETLRWVAEHPAEVLEVVASSATPPPEVAVRYRLEAFDEPVVVPTRTPRTPDGAPTEVALRHLAHFVGTTVVPRPPAYLVPAPVAEHLARHGITTEPVDDSGTDRREVEVATVEGFGTEGGRAILEAAEVGELVVSWRADRRRLPAGSHLVRTDQRLGAVAAYLCEPESDDGALEQGLLDLPAPGTEFPVWRVG